MMFARRFAAPLLIRPSPMFAAAQCANFASFTALQRPRVTERSNLDSEEVGPDQYQMKFFLAE